VKRRACFSEKGLIWKDGKQYFPQLSFIMNLLDHTSIHIVPQLVLVFSDSQNTSENATGHGAEMGNVRCHILYEAEHIL
jgi:hypothetical protein